nr:hypothetical protein CFP56_35260 [Quercus suber]
MSTDAYLRRVELEVQDMGFLLQRPHAKAKVDVGAAEHGAEVDGIAGEDIPIPVGDDAAAADVPPPPSADFDVRRTLETVMTVQQAHGIVCCSPIHQESTEKNIQREGCDWRNQTLLLGSLVTSVSESSDFRLCSMDRSLI